MNKPTEESWEMLKRIGRFLLTAPRVVWRYVRQNPQYALSVCSDSDWAGCLNTRKSTSCTTVCLGRHCLKTHSSTQDCIALSSGEAEYYALVKAASMGIGMQSLARDLGTSAEVRLWTDSAAAKGMASRRGAGRVRHIETATLWLQHAVSRKLVSVHKKDGLKNPADIGTKYLDGPRIWTLLSMLGIEQRAGSSQIALSAAV